MKTPISNTIEILFGQNIKEVGLARQIAAMTHSAKPCFSAEFIDGRRIRVKVNALAVEQFYYRIENSGFVISCDPRLLQRANVELELEAIYSHLQFGAIVPPRSPWPDVRRFVPGRSYELDLDAKTARPLDIRTEILIDSSETDEAAICERFRIELDGVLEEQCPNGDPVILFSGGVDSALLASRAVAMGWSKTTLVNYCFGKNDHESIFAEKMAAHFGLEFVRIMDDGSLDRPALARLARQYPAPFGDHSVVPTNRLTNAVRQRFPERSVVLDGTGADASFGLFAKARACKRFYAIPTGIRSLLSSLYLVRPVWSRTSGIEFFLRMCRRTHQMKPAQAAVAMNPLLGVLYEFPDTCTQQVNDDIESWLNSLQIPKGLTTRLPLIDLLLVTANIFAQKNAPLFDSAEQQIAYPFMDPRLAMLSVSNSSWIRANRQPKAILKKILANDLPISMVYRRKQGFTVPARIYFGQPDYVDLFDEAMASPLLRSDCWAIPSNVRLMRDRLLRQEPMPAHIYHFVWYVVFLYLWMLSLDSPERADGND